MQVARVYTNETCTQNCAFCNARRPAERRSFVAPSAVQERLAAAATEAQTVVLTGGEPTMRRDLAELVAFVRSRDVEVHLETNATLITGALARRLGDAGLARARVHLPAWGEAADAITRDPGGFDRALDGIRALAAAGVVVDVATPVVAANADAVAGMPRHLQESELPIAALVLVVPVTAEDASTLLALPDAARVVEATEAAARAHGIALRLDPSTHVPPCLFRDVGRMARLYTLTPGGVARPGYARIPACERCRVLDRCPGVPEAAAADVAGVARPIAEDRLRRRLSLIRSVEAQVARELYQDELVRRPGCPPIESRTVRINFRCNQVCRFCFVSTHLPDADPAAVHAAIVEVARRGGMIAISGGEPTLSPRVVEYVRLAKQEGAAHVELQSNATRLGDGELADELARAGVDQLFVSLHGSCAEISDAVTGAPGTFDKTVRGIDRAVRTSMRVRLNFVFEQTNLADFPSYVAMVATRWPGIEITTSFVASSSDVVPRTPELMPRYSDVLPHLRAGLALAAARGLPTSGFDSMCGIPLCVAPDDPTGYAELPDVPEGFDRGEFVQTDACARCDLFGKCFGLRRGYAELHGTAELRPVILGRR